MITTMPLKEAQAPYIQRDNVAGRMFDGGLNAYKAKPTVCVYLTTGGKVKTPFTKMSEMTAVMDGTFDYTELDEMIKTSLGTAGTGHYSSATVEDFEGTGEAVIKTPASDPTPAELNVPEGMIAIPILYTGAFQATKLKYHYVTKAQVRSFQIEI